MKAFFDTSVLVGAFYGDHPRHAACLRLLEEASKKTHFCAAHWPKVLLAAKTYANDPLKPALSDCFCTEKGPKAGFGQNLS